MTTRTCKHGPCGKSFEPTDSRQEFCGSTCRANHHYAAHPEKGRPVPSTPLQSVAMHPLADARAEQEASEKHGQVHADDLEDYYPPEYRDRCRKLLPGQLGSLRGRKFIQPTKEYRKSKVKARKGAKSWVYVFTLKGRGLVGVGTGSPNRLSAAPGRDSSPGVVASAHLGETSSTNTGKGPAHTHDATLDRPALSKGDSHAGARSLDDGALVGSSTAMTGAVGEPTALPGLEKEPMSAFTHPEAA